MPEEPEELFCPALTKAVLYQIRKPDEVIMEHDDRFKVCTSFIFPFSYLTQNTNFQIASQTIEISLMTLFMHHYGWTQLDNGRSWNPLKTMKSTQKGLRMIYDSYMEAFLRRRNSCIQWILFGIKCSWCWINKKFEIVSQKDIFGNGMKVGWQSRETAFFNLHEKCLTGLLLLLWRPTGLVLQSFWCMMLSCALFQRQCAKE